MSRKKGFERTSEQVARDVLKKYLEHRVKQYQQYTEKKNHQDSKLSQSNALIRQASRGHERMIDEMPPHLQHFERQHMFRNHHPAMNEPDKNYVTIRLLKEQIDDKILEILSSMNRFKINTPPKSTQIEALKRSIKMFFTEDIDELGFQSNSQFKKIKQALKSNVLNSLINVIVASKFTKDYTNLKEKINKTFEKAFDLIKQIITKKQKTFNELQVELQRIEDTSFAYTKTKLIKIGMEQRLECPNPKISYEKISKFCEIRQLSPQVIDRTSSVYGIMFNQKSFTGLLDKGWLHNSVIDNYVNFLRVSQGYNSERSKTAVYSFGESQLFENAKDYRFNGKRVFTQYDRVGMVINQNNDHWFFIGVLPKRGKLIIYDSILRKPSEYTVYLQKIRAFVRRQQDEFKQEHSIVLNQVEGTTPKQTNGSDCGIHVLWNLTLFLDIKNEDNLHQIEFSVYAIPALRVAMYYFMAYLLSFSRHNTGVSMLNYGLLEYCSRSVMLKTYGEQLWF